MANKVILYEAGKLQGVAGTISGEGLVWDAVASEWLVQLPATFAGEYFVSTTGDDTTGNGSLSAPFASIQKAVNQAKLDYADGVPVKINVAPGSYGQALTVDRFATYIQGSGARADDRGTAIGVPVTVNTAGTSLVTDQVGIAGCYISSTSDAPALSVAGSGTFSLIVSDCYLATSDAGSSASPLACSNANVRSYVTDCVLLVQSSGATAPILNLSGGIHQVSSTRVFHSSNVLATATSKAVVLSGAATLFADRCLIEGRTNQYQIDVSGTGVSLTAAKLTLSNSGVTCLAASGQGLTTSIAPTTLAAVVIGTAFTVASGNAIHSSAASIVAYGSLTFLGASSAITGITASPLTVRTGATQADSLTLPNSSASRFLTTDAAKNVAALATGTNQLIGYSAAGVPVVITVGSGLSLSGNTLTNTGGGGGGGSGTVTSVSAGDGITVTGDPTINPTVALTAISPSPAGSYGDGATVATFTVDAYGRVTAAGSAAIAIDASAINAGTLPISRGGTGTGTAPTAKGVIYADSTTGYASTLAGTTGTVLKGVTSAAPEFGQVNLATDVTGTLPANQQADQTVGGDLSGTTGNATVIKIQNRAISAAAPDVGEVLAWNGTEYVTVPMPSGGSGGGGVIYFFNQATNASGTGLPADTYQLGRTAQAAYSSKTASSISTGGWDRVAGFVTDAGDPNISTLPTGVWDLNLWANTASALGNVRARFVLYAYNNSTDPESGAAIATSSEIELFDQGTSSQYVASLVVPAGVDISGNKRLYLKLEVNASIIGQSVEFGFGDATPSHTHTTVPSVTGTGVVKVLNSVIVATGQQVSLTSEVSGQLPVANGGTGAADAPTARTNLGAAASGANGDITSLTGLTTALSVGQGGTGAQSLTQYGVLIGGGASAITALALGTAGQVLTSNGAGAAPSMQSMPYDLFGQAAGTPDTNTEVFTVEAVRAFTLKATGHKARTKVAPSGGSPVFPIYKTPSGGSASQIGTITFTNGSNTATVAITGGVDVAFGIGDLLTIDTAANLYALEGPSWAFVATCP